MGQKTPALSSLGHPSCDGSGADDAATVGRQLLGTMFLAIRASPIFAIARWQSALLQMHMAWFRVKPTA